MRKKTFKMKNDIPTNIEGAILDLKDKKDGGILAHYYQEAEIQDLADFVGDSLALAQAAAEVDREVIAFCGVHFMAETAKILNPKSTVVVPDLEAGCSLADGCKPEKFKAFIASHPGSKVVSYINTTAEIKALSDLICTSSNAVKMIEHLEGEKIIFAPDRHLGRWVSKKANRTDMILWPGACIVHEQFSAKGLATLKIRHPGARVLSHPECDDSVLAQSDFIASTTGIIREAVDCDEEVLIIATEDGVFHQIEKELRVKGKRKKILQATGMDEPCSCNQCPYMRLNNLEKLYLCLRDLSPEVTVQEELRLQALRPIELMLELSK